MAAEPSIRETNLDWGEKSPAAHIEFDATRLRLVGLDPKDAADQLQFLLSGLAVTQIREDIRTVQVVARTLDVQRLDPSTLGNLTLTNRDGHSIPLSQVGRVVIEDEDPIFKRRDREPVLTVRGDIDESMQPADVTEAVLSRLSPVTSSLPEGYRVETAGSVEESAKANVALGKVFPIMILFMLTTIMIQVRSFRGLAMVFMTAPLGLVGAAPILLAFGQPFGFNAILGLIGLAGILMRNTLILLGQIDADQKAGMAPREAVIEATVRRARPVVLTAAAALLAFIPLTFSSFWGPMAFTLIGGVGVGTVLTILFLPALYALFFKIPRDRRGATTTASSAGIRTSVA
jgi:multidrug efflux pump subunit AcrB